VQIGEALHTYLQISDIGTVKVKGLEGSDYHDKVDNFARKKQKGAIGLQMVKSTASTSIRRPTA
jgi:D-hexose-6-phosphate mutarotase